MMHIKIIHGHFLETLFLCLQGRDGNLVEIAKPHRLILRGMMSRWPHQAE